jgi:hypothetical protein
MDLDLLPWPEAAGTDEHRHGLDLGDLILQLLRRREAGPELLAVEPRVQAEAAQPHRDLLDLFLVGAVMAKEDVELVRAAYAALLSRRHALELKMACRACQAASSRRECVDQSDSIRSEREAGRVSPLGIEGASLLRWPRLLSAVATAARCASASVDPTRNAASEPCVRMPLKFLALQPARCAKPMTGRLKILKPESNLVGYLSVAADAGSDAASLIGTLDLGSQDRAGASVCAR